jgi:hypothetical protein
MGCVGLWPERKVESLPTPEPSFTWQDGAVAYLVVLLAAFLVTWVVTDRFKVRRTPYIALLTAMVLGLGAWYLGLSGSPLAALVTSNVAWGLAAGILVAALVTPLLRRLPGGEVPGGIRRVGQFAWEDVVYGAAEALLLAVYPVLAISQATAAAGWTDTWAGKVESAALAILGSLLVILVHHLGYEEFRTQAARPKLAGALFTCGLQALAFLLTGTVIAPIVAHVALHLEMTLHGSELPPVHLKRDHVPDPEVHSRWG